MPSEVSRDEVLDVVRRGFADGRQPSMGELAVAAGVAPRTLYRLFGGRESLLHEAGCIPQPDARQRVLGVALDRFGRHGLANLSMDDLALSAGISRATLYRLFPGKASLFAALVKTYSPWEPVADVLDDLGDAPPEEMMPAVAQAIAGAMEPQIGVLLRIVLELRDGNPDTAEAIGSSMARGLPDVVSYLEGQMRASRLRQMNPVLALQLLAGPIMAHHLTRPLAEQTTGFSDSEAEVLEEIVGAWLRAMAPDDSH